MMRRLLPVLVVALAASGAGAAEIRPLGPLFTRSMFPLDLVTLDMKAEPAVMTDPGVVTLGLQLVHSNTFEITKNYDERVAYWESGIYPAGYDLNVDAETTRAAFLAEFQLGRRFALGADIPLISHGGGFMDDMIESVHDALGLPQNGRDLKEQDQINVDLLAGSGRLRLADDEAALGDVTLRAKAMVFDGDRATWTAVAEVKAPTGEQETFTGTGEWDWGLSMLVTAGGRHHFFHGGAGYQALGQPETWPFEIDDRISAFAGYEWRANSRWSVVTHVMLATSILPEQDGYPQGSERAELVAGFHWRRDDFVLSAGFIENLTTNDNTADLGFVVQGSWRLGD